MGLLSHDRRLRSLLHLEPVRAAAGLSGDKRSQHAGKDLEEAGGRVCEGASDESSVADTMVGTANANAMFRSG